MITATSLVSRVAWAPGSQSIVSLIQGSRYEVIGINNDYYKIVDESLYPTSYPKSYFIEDDLPVPQDWQIVRYDDDDDGYDAGIPLFFRDGFFEDFYDQVNDAQQIYFDYVNSAARKAEFYALQRASDEENRL